LSQFAYGAAAAVIAADAGPCHACPVNPDVTDENDDAADPNSEANPSQAAAALNMGAEPAPENIRAELISGANTEKFIATSLRQRPAAITPAASSPTTCPVYPYTKSAPQKFSVI
jgi:hypothetical protein